MLLCAVVFCMSGYAAVNAETLAELEYPKAPFYRVGISELPEKQYIQAVQKKVKVEKTYAKIDDSLESNVMDMTYADLSIKRLSKEIAQDLEFEEQDMIADLSLLWQGAAMQSDTINFALYKLANPDADKPDSKSVKKSFNNNCKYVNTSWCKYGKSSFGGLVFDWWKYIKYHVSGYKSSQL